MWYLEGINATLIEEICTPVLRQLIADEYRAGFNDSVTQKCRDTIAEVDAELARKFWSASCCGDITLRYPKNAERGIFTVEFMKLMDEAEEEQKKEGCFVMPEWGTRGT